MKTDVFDAMRYGGNHKEDYALIAAAPELYAALREAVNEFSFPCRRINHISCGTCDRGDCLVKGWRAALEKAGGEAKGGANQGAATR